jgi:hypothetical protein
MDDRAKELARERARRYRARKRGEVVPKKKPGPVPGRSNIPFQILRREDNVVTFDGLDADGRSLWTVAGRIAGHHYQVMRPDGHQVGPDEWVDPLERMYYEPGQATYVFLTVILFDGLRLTAPPDLRQILTEILRTAAADKGWSIKIQESANRIILTDKGRATLLAAADDLESGAPYAKDKEGIRLAWAGREQKGDTSA